MKQSCVGPVIAVVAANLGVRSSSLFRGAAVPLAEPSAELGLKQSGVVSLPSWGAAVPLVRVGAQPGLAQTGIASRPRKARRSHRHLSLQLCSGMSGSLVAGTRSPGNKSANTDPQLQEAASRLKLRSGCLQRYLPNTRYD